MCAFLPKSPRRSSGNFQKILGGFLKQPGLPFSDVLDEQTIESVFDKHGSLFAMNAIFCTATTLWAFLGQVLQDGKQAAEPKTMAAANQSSGGSWFSNCSLCRGDFAGDGLSV